MYICIPGGPIRARVDERGSDHPVEGARFACACATQRAALLKGSIGCWQRIL